MNRISRFLALPLAVGLMAACGSSSDNKTEAATTAAPAVPAVTDAATTAAPAPTEAATTAAPAPTEAATAAPAPAAGPIDVELAEWTLIPKGDIKAGTVTFNAKNVGQFPHELLVVKGDSYASLPKDDLGAVLEDQLPAGSILVDTGRLGPGEAAEATADLAPGKYVLICNLAGGGVSHAAKGQTLDLTVA